jgi:hypothetical protein
MKMALAVLTYDRAHYLSLVLSSILGQSIDGAPVAERFDLYVFQDGFCPDDKRSSEAGHREVSEIIDRLPPYVERHRQSENLGVALHFDFVEKLLFKDKAYDFVIFCEDDLVLGAQYLSVMKKLAVHFEGDPRVGMIAAHPSNPTKLQADQCDRLQDYAEMGHNWAFGLYRQFWEKRQPFVELYLNFIRDVPYRKRPTRAVLKWLELCGFNPNGSSQDYVKQCATAALGAARISTFPNFALPIGRHGLHSNSEVFERFGFGKSVICERQIHEPGELDAARYDQIFGSQQRTCIIDRTTFPKPAKWQNMVKNGSLDPEMLISKDHVEQVELLSPISRSWSPSEIPRRPHMEAAGLALLSERLSSSSCFLEYGAGGSTMLAAEIGVPKIYSVESDRAFLCAVKEAVAEVAPAAKLFDQYVDIGPTVEWGNPRDSSKATKWPLYSSSIWSEIITQSEDDPDLVLIDGRFRVASFLATLIFAKPGTTILFDDYVDRPHYHVVEKYLRPVSQAGRMAEFRTNDNPPREVLLDLMAYSTNFG